MSRTLVLAILITLPLAACAQSTTAPADMASSDTELAPLPPAADAASSSTKSGAALDQPIEKIAASANGCAILDKDFPGMREHPMFGYLKSMSLNQVAAMSHGRITSEMLAQAKVDLAAFNVASVAPINTAAATPKALIH